MTHEDLYLSVVAPFLNEEEAIIPFCEILRETLDGLGREYEVLLVDDGSTDGTVETLLGLNWPSASIVCLQRNVGHQVALDAGLKASRGRWVVTMDSDLQHPPHLIPEMLSAADDADVDVVYAAREAREEDGPFKRVSASAYYRIVSRLTAVDVVPNAADFRLMSRRVVNIVNQVPDEKVFRVLLPYLGFSSVTVNYVAATRIAGSSKYSLGKMIKLAVTSALSFSSRPLRWIAEVGLGVSFLALAWLAFVVVSYLLGRTVEGWASVASIVLLIGGFQLLAIGIFGLYLGRLYDASTGRPQFIVAETVSLARQVQEDRVEEL